MTTAPLKSRRPRVRLRGFFVVAAIGVGVAIYFGPHVRYQYEARLAHTLAARAISSPSNYRPAIREIEALGLPGVTALVELAASQRPEVAAAAASAIVNEMTRWEFAFATRGDHGQLAEEYEILPAALARYAAAFNPQSHAWAHQLARRMAAYTPQLLAAESLAILMNCETVLARPLPPGPVAGFTIPPREASQPARARASAAKPLPRAKLPLSETASSLKLAETPITREEAPSELNVVDDGDYGSETALQDAAVGPATRSSSNVLRTRPPTEDDEAAAITATAAPAAPPIDIPSPQERRRQLQELRERSDAELLDQWRVASKLEAQAMREVLRQRGYNDSLLEFISDLRAEPAPQRRKSLSQVTTMPAADARRVLRILVIDADAEVRMAAITMLATAGDPQLPTLLRQRAVEDTDPRVADLASQILQQK